MCITIPMSLWARNYGTASFYRLVELTFNRPNGVNDAGFAEVGETVV